MNSLKTVAERVKKSPQIIRKKFGGQFDNQNQHQELREDWLHEPEPLNDGVPFYVKWLGRCQVFNSQGTGCTDEAVKRIVEDTKKFKKSKEGCRLQKVLLTVTTKCLKIEDMNTHDLKMEVPMYRISYCTADLHYPKVFAFVAREPRSKVLNCHALLCSKESMAQAISLTVADAFSTAYEAFEKVNQAKRTKVLSDVAPVNSQPSLQKEKPVSLLALSQQASLSDENKSNSFENTSSLSKVPTDNNNIFTDLENPFLQVENTKSSTNPFIQSTTSTFQNTSNPPCIKVTGDAFLETLSGSVNDSANRIKALDLAVDNDDFDAQFTELAEARSSNNLFETPVRRSDFHDDITTLLANEQTARDMMKSLSQDDLLFTG